MSGRCPCGTGRAHGDCCGPYLAGGDAPTAEALMRSRYSAFALADEAHLARTWHPSTLPRRIGFVAGQVWTGLEVGATAGGGLFDTEGTVAFVARYERDGAPGELRERSRFTKLDGRWLYVDALPDGGS